MAPEATQAPGTPAGKYVADNPSQWDGHTSVGDAERGPRAADGRVAARRALVRGNKDIKPGTATFDSDGRYGGHTDRSSYAAIYVKQDERGLWGIDQWNVRANGVIARRQAPHMRQLQWEVSGKPTVDQGEYYHVVQ